MSTSTLSYIQIHQIVDYPFLSTANTRLATFFTLMINYDCLLVT